MSHDAIIVGAGPAGLAAAIALREAGLGDVVVVEREAEAGGVPRHCGHGGYGLREFRRWMTGPDYARALVAGARDVDVRTNTTALAVEAGGRLVVAGPRGVETLSARRILLATGVRETPRAARLVGGTRPWGVMTTGTLQQFAYLSPVRPCRRIVVVGTELVAFSALLTARHAGIAVAAMIEEGGRIVARRPGDWIARLAFGVPVLTETRLVAVEGGEQVEAALVETCGVRRRIACDGIVFSGRFVPETALIKGGPIALDTGTGGPVVDQHFRTVDPHVLAAGNLLHPVETAGVAWAEGRAAATALVADLAGRLPPGADAVPVVAAGALRYLYPQRVVAGAPSTSSLMFRARAAASAHGDLTISVGGQRTFSARRRVLPERRIPLPADAILAAAARGPVRVALETEGDGG